MKSPGVLGVLGWSAWRLAIQLDHETEDEPSTPSTSRYEHEREL